MQPRVRELLLVFASGLGTFSFGAESLRFEVQSVSYFHVNMTSVGPVGEKPAERGRWLEIRLTFSGQEESRIRAARTFIDRAQDDTGATPLQYGGRQFYQESVGRVEGDSSLVTSKRPFSFSLEGIARGAKTLRSIEGVVEAFLPETDPNATVIVDRIASRIGEPLEYAGLTEAGVTLTFIDAKKEGGLAAMRADAEKTFGPGLPKGLYRIGENEIGVSLVDPEERVVGMEFQASDGRPLRYNHNGNAHYSGAGGRKVHVFAITPLPDDARFVCWLITKKSLVRIPLKLTELPLPPPPAF